MSKLNNGGFTPGPWSIRQYRDREGGIPIDPQRGTTVAIVLDNHDANARLIAAAPEMYEALQFILDANTRLIDARAVAENKQEMLAEELDGMARVVGSLITRIASAVVLLLLIASTTYAQSSQTATASAYGRQGCRSALLNVSRVADGSGTHTWASYTVWTCAPGAVDPEQIASQQNGVLIPDGQFVVGQGGQSWRLTLSTAAGNVTLTWTPDGRVHSTYDATWTSTIAGQQGSKTVRSLDTQSAPPIGVMFGLTPEAVSGTIMRGSDVTR